MLIISQDKQKIINPANVTGIYIEGTTIYADGFCLGYYQTKDEAIAELHSLRAHLTNEYNNNYEM